MASGASAVSSLLKTAQAAQTQLYAYNDAAAAYDWNLSAKNQDDLNTYLGYLQKRQDGINSVAGADASAVAQTKALALQQKMVDARRTFTSAEISRQTISVLEGDESNTQKYAKLNSLMASAAQTGDAQLFQTLDSTRASLSKTIQDEAAASAASASAAASAAESKGYTAAINQHDMALKTLQDAYETGQPLTNPNGSAIKVKFGADGKPVLDGSGNLQPDPNGQPLQLNAQSYARLKGLALQSQAATIQQHAQATGDPEGTYAKDLLNLQSSADYKNYATPQALARNGSSANPFVTDITQNSDGTQSRSLRLDPMQTSAVIDPKTGQLTTKLNPQEGVISGGAGSKFVETTNIGSSPNSPYDRTSSSIKTIDTTNKQFPQGAPINIGDGLNVKGYGKQQVIANPNQFALPSGKARSPNIFIAPDGSGIHSVQPLKPNGNGADGKTIYTTTTPADFQQPGMPDANPGIIGSIVGGITSPSTFTNDLSATGTALKAGVNGVAAPVIKAGTAALGSLVPGGGAGINAIGNLLGFGTQQNNLRQQELDALAAAQPKVQPGQQLSAAAQAFLQHSSASQSAITAAAFAKLNAQTIANRGSSATPAENYLQGSGGATDPSSIARGIFSATGYNTLGGGNSWWNI